MSGNETQLPPGWESAQLSDIAAIIMGQSPPSSTYNVDGHGLPFFQGKGEFGSLYPEARVWCSQPGKVAKANDVLLSIRAPVGPTNLALTECCIGRGLAAVRPASGLDLKYVLHAFRRFADDLDAKGTGTTFKAVSGKVVREFRLPIAPAKEQPRIADALDELLSDLDAGVAALERARAKLALYRASVLKAAVEGALTAGWRQQHPHAEPASQLLARILVERRRQWEEEQLAKFKGKGHEPPHNWKAKYKEPTAPDLADRPALPTGWGWATAEQCTSMITDGEHITPQRSPSGVLLLSARNVLDGRLSLDDVDFVPQPEYERISKRLVIASGDVLLSCSGTVGRSAVVPDGLTFTLVRSVAILKPTIAMGRFISLALRSPLLQLEIHRKKTQTAQSNIFQGKIKTLRIPIPPLAEQGWIVESVDDQLSVVDHVEADLDTRLKTAQSLRQGILHHAFTGQLVRQDPHDEPASELLMRIAAERERRTREAVAAPRAHKQPPKPRAGRKPLATKEATSLNR